MTALRIDDTVIYNGREATVKALMPASKPDRAVVRYADGREDHAPLSLCERVIEAAVYSGSVDADGVVTPDDGYSEIVVDVLTDTERQQLESYEVVIQNGLQQFVEVGNALLAIRDSRLYRQQHKTFEDYCQRRWQMERRHAYRLMDAAAAVENVSNWTQTPPQNEAQARELTALEPDEQRLVWDVVQRTAPAGKVTAAHVKSVVGVLKEVTRTGAIDNGEGESIPVSAATTEHLKAAVTEETYERLKRQETYVADKLEQTFAAEQQREQKRQRAQNLPAGVYNVVYADPPWQYGNTGVNGAAEAHYETMPTSDICTLLGNIQLQLDDNAVLFMWVTNAHVPDALEVLSAWGFTYKTNMVWVKTELDRPGSGWYVRGRHELLFIATRGSFTPLDNHIAPPIGSVFEAPLHKQHSRKPETPYSIIERLYPACRYVELFARRRRDGWDTFGNEVSDGAE